jgi:hypothetical protein
VDRVTELFLDSTDLPATWAAHVLDAAQDEVLAIASTTDCLATSPRHFGPDDIGTALNAAAEHTRREIADRLRRDAGCLNAASVALTVTARRYAALVATNSITER